MENELKIRLLEGSKFHFKELLKMKVKMLWLHWVVENKNKSFVTRLKFLLQRVVDSLIVGDDHRVTSHRAVILKTILNIQHYPFHFQKEMRKNMQGLGNSMTTYCDCMSCKGWIFWPGLKPGQKCGGGLNGRRPHRQVGAPQRHRGSACEPKNK